MILKAYRSIYLLCYLYLQMKTSQAKRIANLGITESTNSWGPLIRQTVIEKNEQFGLIFQVVP